ncbi:MAG: DUF533 domain-containing protein [Alphaproteobacteria bacterium]
MTASERDADGGGKGPSRRGGHGPVLHQILAQKILRSHLQNRHQVIDRGLADLDGRPPDEKVLLIRAMAAAAHADGALDPQEHEILLAALESVGFQPEVRRSLEQEILEPPCFERLARQVEPSSRAAARFYAVSLRLLERDNQTQIAYLNYLAHRLKVPRDVIVRLNRRFGLPA